MSEEVPFNLQWETLGSEGEAEAILVQRARVFGGWLVRSGAALAFVPDAEGRWDGEDFGEYEEYEEDEEEEEEEDEEGGGEDEGEA